MSPELRIADAKCRTIANGVRIVSFIPCEKIPLTHRIMLWRERGTRRNMGDGLSGNRIKSENLYNKKKTSIDKRNEGAREGHSNGHPDYPAAGRTTAFLALIQGQGGMGMVGCMGGLFLQTASLSIVCNNPPLAQLIGQGPASSSASSAAIPPFSPASGMLDIRCHVPFAGLRRGASVL